MNIFHITIRNGIFDAWLRLSTVLTLRRSFTKVDGILSNDFTYIL